MKTYILTCDRTPAYLPGTLASLEATAPSVEPTILRDSWSRDLPAKQRLTLSFRKALTDAGEDVLIVEDDVIFGAHWQEKLAAAIAWGDALKGPIESVARNPPAPVESAPAEDGPPRPTSAHQPRGGEVVTTRKARHYFLACYSPHLFVGEPVSPYIRRFYGTQACFVPDQLRSSLADYLDKNQATSTLDVLIKSLADAEDVRLFATVPSLVQHVGEVSALGDQFHSSPMF